MVIFADKVDISSCQRVRVFLVDPDKKVLARAVRWFGRSCNVPFTMKTFPQAGAVMFMDGENAPMTQASGFRASGLARFSGPVRRQRRLYAGNKSITHILDGAC